MVDKHIHVHSHCTLSESQLGRWSVPVGKGMKLERWVLDHAGKAHVHNTSLSMMVTAWSNKDAQEVSYVTKNTDSTCNPTAQHHSSCTDSRRSSIPLRPFVLTISSPVYQLSKLLAKILTPLEAK